MTRYLTPADSLLIAAPSRRKQLSSQDGLALTSIFDSDLTKDSLVRIASYLRRLRKVTGPNEFACSGWE